MLTLATSPLERLLAGIVQWILEMVMCSAEISFYSFAKWALFSAAGDAHVLVKGNDAARASVAAGLGMLMCFWGVTFRVCRRWKYDNMYVLNI